MGRKKRSNDPLTRALDEAPFSQTKSGTDDIAQQPTPHAQPIGEVLETLQAQTLDAMSGPFFDEGATTEVTPVSKRMRSESGTVQVSAKRHDPAIEAKVTIDVRCDHESGEAGRYQLRATGQVTRENKDGDIKSEFPVAIDMQGGDGSLTLVSGEMRDGIANAIRSTGKSRK